MSSKTQFVAAALSALMVLSVAGAGAAVAQEETDDLTVDITQNDAVDVTVENDNGSVANASVAVSAAENASYEGVGEYETDDNGSVELPAPDERLNVTVTAAFDNETASATATLVSAEEGDDGDDEDDEIATGEPFGQQVQEFVQSLIDGDTSQPGTIGHQIAEFVTSNNPGNAPDRAGPDGDRDASDDETERGPPEDEGDEEEEEAEDEEDEREDEREEDEEEGERDEEDDAGNGGNNGNGQGPPEDDRN